MKTAKTAIARNLRKNQTDCEQILWRNLRNRQIDGAKFRRQHIIGPYVVDFFCAESDLIIEVDGGQHNQSNTTEKRRTEFLVLQGYRILRFWNHEVLENLNGVLEEIRKTVNHPHPHPLPQRGRGKKEETSLRS